MLAFWPLVSLVRNSVVLTVYPLFWLLASLPYMSIRARVVIAVTFQQVDDAPDTEAGSQCDNEGLQNVDCAVEKFHTVTVQHPVKGTLIFGQNRENKISVSSLL